MNCSLCNVKMIEKNSVDPNGFDYKFLYCPKCGEEILTMSQLHELAEKYKEMKRYRAKLSKWGESIAVRIPKSLVKEYKLKEKQEVSFIPEKKAIKIVAL